MDLCQQIYNYFVEVKYTDWSVLRCLKSIQDPMLTSDSTDEIATLMKDIIGIQRKSESLLMNAKRKLKRLESSFKVAWNNSEVQQYFNQLDLSHTNVGIKLFIPLLAV